MKKTLSTLIAGLGLAGLLYAGNTSAQDVPLTKVGDGRPSMAETFEKDPYKKIDWYLSVPVINNTHIKDVDMFGGGYKLIKKALKLEVPDMDTATIEELLALGEDLNEFSKKDVSGSLTTHGMVKFGILSKYVEFHGEVCTEGAIEFDVGGTQEIDMSMVFIDPETGNWGLKFEKDQNLLDLIGYFDVVTKGTIVTPINIQDKVIIKPFASLSYRHREAYGAMIHLNSILKTGDDIFTMGKKNPRNYGNGFFMDTGFILDMRKLDPKYTRPVIGFELENIVSVMEWQKNIAGFKKDPFRVNLGFQISPYNLFDIRMDFLNLNNIPEYRIEIAKRYKEIEVALFGRFYETTLLGNQRHSFNVFLGLNHKIVDLGFYAGIDNQKKPTFGLMLSLGYKPWMHGP